ncbi:MAG: DUF4037 domain-containing protein [Lachnospiraceae bacterium]|nr:DUF4037 domain-containing protein [Lachnospiraceae bacterium]
MTERFTESRRFYENEVAPMIHGRFAEYEDRIAVGLAGEGSDCFGYDDLISRDHDFGTGVCLWLTEEDMCEFGKDLSDAYGELLDLHGGGGLSARLRERRGVMTVNDFYSNVLGANVDAEMIVTELRDREAVQGDEFWNIIDDSCLATAVNGEVFRDDPGVFTAFRNMLLDYYPESVWRMRIAEELHKYASALQVNYARCMTRGDVVTANICRHRGIEAAMQLFFLLKREYPPYYKWTYRRMEELDRDGTFCGLIRDLSENREKFENWKNRRYDPDKLNYDDKTVVIGERIASLIVNMLGQRGFIRSTDPYLENYVDEVLRAKRDSL